MQEKLLTQQRSGTIIDEDVAAAREEGHVRGHVPGFGWILRGRRKHSMIGFKKCKEDKYKSEEEERV